MYTASVTIHVLAAIVGFGATFTYPVIQLFGEERGRSGALFAMGAILAISRWVAVPATTIVGITGAYQLARGPYGFDEPWLSVSVALYLFVMIAGIFLLAPAYRRADVALRKDSPDEYRAALRLPTLVGPIVAGAIVATAVLMEVKPG